MSGGPWVPARELSFQRLRSRARLAMNSRVRAGPPGSVRNRDALKRVTPARSSRSNSASSCASFPISAASPGVVAPPRSRMPRYEGSWPSNWRPQHQRGDSAQAMGGGVDSKRGRQASRGLSASAFHRPAYGRRLSARARAGLDAARCCSSRIYERFRMASCAAAYPSPWNGRTSTGRPHASAAFRPHSEAAAESDASMIQQPPIGSLLCSNGPVLVSTSPP
jgi:hypothetical protein